MRIFKHYIPFPIILLGIVEFFILFGMAELAWNLRAAQIGSPVGHINERLFGLLTFAVAIHGAMISVGLYNSESLHSVRFGIARILVAVVMGAVLISIVQFLFPDPIVWRSIALYAVIMAVAGISLLRSIVAAFWKNRFRKPILVLGAGNRAQRIADLAAQPEAGFCVVGHVAMTTAPMVVEDAVPRADIDNLSTHAVALGAHEVVLAIEERRNALPLNDLLRIKTTGIDVNEFSNFIERETGRIDLATTNPSGLIFSDGFSAGLRISKILKRLFDIVASVIVLIIGAPLILIAAIAVKLESRGPALYRQARVGLFGEPYTIVKLRSMRVDAESDGKAVWAAEKDPRITRVGRFIRKTRIDEIPQTWCVLKGDMSIVGPRPERPEIVADLARELPYYAERHMVKPGLTGWAQINYPYGASIEDARNKLEYDLYYAKNYSPFLDLLILMQTVRVVLWNDGAR